MNWWGRFIASRSRRRASVMAIHATLLAVSYLAAQAVVDIRLFGRPDSDIIALELLLWMALGLATSYGFHTYETVWAFVGVGDLEAIAKASTLSSVLFGAIVIIFPSPPSPSALILAWLISTGIALVIRVSVTRAIERRSRPSSPKDGDSPPRRALIVGAGDSAASLLRENVRNLGSGYDIAGLIDDDPEKQARRIHGATVVGRLDDLPQLVDTMKIDELLLAIPSAAKAERRRIIAKCLACGKPLKSVPSLAELLRGRSIAELTEVDPVDLLGREPIDLDPTIAAQQILDARVMITGAGGSIGSELCKRVAAMHPDRLILFERAESALHSVAIDLEDEFSDLRFTSIVGDINDEMKVNEVIKTHRPDIIFHAAAYKHVHLMEAHPLEAIRNNVFGTKVLARAAVDARVAKFVLISTDKAVHPVGVMGMTKKVAEDAVRLMPAGSTTFVAVRFGNVLGSVGSVLPLFQRQVSRRRSVTLTNPDATRYFMLVSEAALLVLQAAAMGEHGDVLFLDMGAPVRIKDLADRIIMLSGFTPGLDVPVEVVGLRPGERLDESLIHTSEELVETDSPFVFRVRSSVLDRQKFEENLQELHNWVDIGDAERAAKQLVKMARSD